MQTVMYLYGDDSLVLDIIIELENSRKLISLRENIEYRLLPSVASRRYIFKTVLEEIDRKKVYLVSIAHDLKIQHAISDILTDGCPIDDFVYLNIASANNPRDISNQIIEALRKGPQVLAISDRARA